jgi:hypothetical protein
MNNLVTPTGGIALPNRGKPWFAKRHYWVLKVNLDILDPFGNRVWTKNKKRPRYRTVKRYIMAGEARTVAINAWLSKRRKKSKKMGGAHVMEAVMLY